MISLYQFLKVRLSLLGLPDYIFTRSRSIYSAFSTQHYSKVS